MLPNGYLQVKYIENPNEGYIKTDIVPENSNCGFEIKFKLNDISKDNIVFGHNFNNLSDSPKLYIYYRYSDTNTVLYQTRKYDATTYTGSLKSILDITDTEHAHIVRVPMIDYTNTYGTKSNEVYVDGKLKTVDDNYSVLQIDSTHLSVYRFFSLNDSDSNKGDSKIYWVKTYDVNNKVNHEFIPCIRISDNVVGFYETYTGKFFSSSNSNQLVAGPVVSLPKEYTMVEYIKNTGSEAQQCALDTGMKFSLLNYSIEAKFKLDEVSNGMVLGTYTTDTGTMWFYNYGANANRFYVLGCLTSPSSWVINAKCYEPLDTEIHIVKYTGSLTSNKTYCDGILKNVRDLSSYASEYSTDNLFIFGRALSANCYNGRIYYVKLWNTSTKLMLLYYIPCIRKSDNKAGFYDIVSHSFKCIERDYWVAGPKLITKGKSIDLIQQRARSQSNILPYTCLVEYLETTGTLYINTGIVASSNSKAEVCGNFTEHPTDYLTLVGSLSGSGPYLYTQFVAKVPNSSGKYYVQIGSSYATSNVSDLNKHIFIGSIQNNVIKLDIDGTSVQNAFSGTLSTNPQLIFAHSETNASKRSKARVYYCKLWNDGVLVRDFIPVRVGNIGYMYDKISEKLFGNSGTGNFVLGQDIVPVEYLEATGTQYINTGFIPNDESGFYAHYYRTSSNNSGTIIGCRESSSVDSYWYLRDVSTIRIGWVSANDVSFTRPCWVEVENNFLNSRKGKVNGVDKISNYPTLVSITKPTLIFACYNIDAPGFFLTGKIKSIKISQGNQVVYDFIPVRVGTTGYMYDKVSNRLFGNSGTGNFLFGEDIKKDYAKRYLTIEPLGSGNVTITIPAEIDSTYMTSISYSKDMVNWTDTAIDNTALTITIPVVNGDNVYIKGIGYRMSDGSGHNGNITCSANYNISGNILSLLYGDSFIGKTTFKGASSSHYFNFLGLFSDSTTLLNSHHLILPVLSLNNFSYGSMFKNCSLLLTPPVLPATSLSAYSYYSMFNGCLKLKYTPRLPALTMNVGSYSYMFRNCRELTKTSELPATTLARSCYSAMFVGCTGLTTAPELKALTLAESCYSQMFNGCTNINYIKMLATDISANGCLYNWVNAVSSAGTFIRNSEMTTLPSGASGIPEGWTVQTSNN